MGKVYCAGGGTQACGYAIIPTGSEPPGCGHTGQCDYQRPRTMEVKWTV